MRHALRVSMACLAVGLAVAAFRVAQLAPPLASLGAVFGIACSARLQNDWRDRVHDINKGKTFASVHPRLFLLGLAASWGVCCLLVAVIAVQSPRLALILAALMLAGALYSETRRVPWLPICLSATASAAPAVLPLALGGDSARILPLVGAAGLLVFGREILKDIEDAGFDGGYKWTIPLAYGHRAARWLVISSIGAGCMVVAALSAPAVVGIVLAGIGLVLFWRNASPAATMKWLDAGAALAIIALAAFPPGGNAWML